MGNGKWETKPQSGKALFPFPIPYFLFTHYLSVASRRFAFSAASLDG